MIYIKKQGGAIRYTTLMIQGGADFLWPRDKYIQVRETDFRQGATSTKLRHSNIYIVTTGTTFFFAYGFFFHKCKSKLWLRDSKFQN